MLASLLPIIESLAAQGGTAAAIGGRAAQGGAMALGRGGGLGQTIGRLLSPGVQAFGSEAELSGAMSQISDLTSSIAAAKKSMEGLDSSHGKLQEKGDEQERLSMFRDPGLKDQMAQMQRQKIVHATQMQNQQRQMEGLQSRAALSLDPGLAASEARFSMFRKAGALAAGGQAVQSLGPSFVRNFPGVQEAGAAMDFVGGAGGKIANRMAAEATGAVSNVAGGAMQGASIGMLAGPGGAVAGAAIGGIASASKELALLPKRITDWSEALLESTRPLTQFSTHLQQAAIEAEGRGLSRNIASAEATGGASASLSNSLQDLYDSVRPMGDAVTITIASGLTVAVNKLSQLVNVVEGLYEAAKHIPFAGKKLEDIEKWLDKMEKRGIDPGKGVGFINFVNEASQPPKKPKGH